MFGYELWYSEANFIFALKKILIYGELVTNKILELILGTFQEPCYPKFPTVGTVVCSELLKT